MTRTRGRSFGTTCWIFMVVMGCATGVAGCVSPQEGAASAVPDSVHNSRNALDWAGTYEGVTRCADCPGVRVRLTLERDGRFERSTQHLERPASAQTARGRFSWNAAGNTITLEGAGGGEQFRVGEGRLLQLDRDGRVPPWNEPGRVLTRQPD